MFNKNKAMLITVSLLISTTAFIVLFAIVYNVSCIISPPYFENESGKRFPVMPMGQAFLGFIFATLGSIISLVICYKKFKKK